MMTMKNSSTNLLFVTFSLAILWSSCCGLQISEFLASNDAGLQDEDGDFSDWIEIHNPSSSDPVLLTNLCLTDNIGDLTQWEFPASAGSLAASSYLVVFASNKNRSDGPEGEFHTNFRLGAGGEYLALYDKSSNTILDEYTPEYPSQSADVSYGIDSNDNLGFFSNPTPGAANPERDEQNPEPVTADMERGFYSSAFGVTLSSETPGAEIRYTLDGSNPTANTGTVFVAGTPVQIGTTTNLRARAFLQGSTEPSPTATFSYIFLDSVLQQSATISGFPNGNSRDTGFDNLSGPLDMEMDPGVISAFDNEVLVESMTAIPTMSLTGSIDDFFGSNGFYLLENDVEHEMSLELLYADSAGDAQASEKNDQINVGVQNHSHNRLKRSLRLEFRSEYGNREWETNFFEEAPLNGDTVTDKFRTLILRAGNNRSWARTWNPEATTLTLDQFYRDSQIAISGSGSHGRFVHLYLNGVYWGIYNVVERLDDQFAAAYLEDDNDNMFYTNHGGAGLGRDIDFSRWDFLTDTLVFRDMTESDNYAEFKQHVDVGHFTDYIILCFWIGMTDWPGNNWFVNSRTASSELGPTPARFFAWDGEWSMDRRNLGSFSTGDGAFIQTSLFEDRRRFVPDGIIVQIWHALRARSEYRAFFTSRVDLLTGDGGALSDAAALARWDTLNNHLESAIIAESARWGDSLESLSSENDEFGVTRTLEDFQSQANDISGLLQGNKDRLIDRLMDAGLLGNSLLDCLESTSCKVLWFLGGNTVKLSFFGLFCFDLCLPFADLVVGPIFDCASCDDN